jgi:hypothetical protein
MPSPHDRNLRRCARAMAVPLHTHTRTHTRAHAHALTARAPVFLAASMMASMLR